MSDFLKKRWVYHSLIWLVVICVLTVMSIMQGEELSLSSFGRMLVSTSPMAIAIYVNFYLKDILFGKRKYILYVLTLPLLTIIIIWAATKLLPLVVETSMTWQNHTTNIVFAMIFTTVLQYFKRGMVGQYQLQELRAKTAETELNALKAQINPHFLFNTLNNIYATNEIDAQQGSQMIMELSEVMRYHLRFSKMKKVSLQEEIQLIRAYIELEKLRLNSNCDLQTDWSQVDSSIKIASLIFLPFIENAFKYGSHPTQDCFIHLDIKTQANSVDFELSNSIIHRKKVVKTHIGLTNTIRRLEIIYPNQHTLDIRKTEDIYTIKLNLQV